jgi:hypothetical protein
MLTASKLDHKHCIHASEIRDTFVDRNLTQK